MSSVRYIKCDNKNCDVMEEVDVLVGIANEGWYTLYSDAIDIDLCSYNCLQDYVNSGGTQ